MTFTAVLNSFELGLIYAVLALGVFLSFRTLNTPDLTVDGSIVTGAAASAILCSTGYSPLVALLASFLLAALAGAATALLNIKLKIEPLLAGILVMLALYSLNLRLMGGKSNIALTQSPTLYKNFHMMVQNDYSSLLLGIIILVLVTIVLYFFLNTRIGFALRATGDNEYMVRASGVNSNLMKLLGLSLSNGFVGLAGGLLAQYQSYSDVSMGVGMVVIGLASVIVGETIFEFFTKSIPLLIRLLAVSVGAILYRLALAFALSCGMPATDLKLISAVIVAIALSTGIMKDSFPKKKIYDTTNTKNFAKDGEPDDTH
ncbi:ABC transporter permease [Sinanaerobacter sp. ZZT-01]|uniref:ABC transporter permease n=1 Tax=Sinanaerobacter sp. ZZT-01 TaxID=3111540 RepID=UPI002D7666B2|nr:ABC transporter permease [Sinanaerobacter sp. ZZT-01]WRR93419.1 ABC transporter permease [Sinanaerobacter sp. ZZT-01]